MFHHSQLLHVICVKSDKLTTGLQFTCQKMPKSFIGFVKKKFKKNITYLVQIPWLFKTFASTRIELRPEHPSLFAWISGNYHYLSATVDNCRQSFYLIFFIANKLFLVSWIFLRKRFFQLSAQRQGYKTLFTASINVDALIKRPFKCCAF